MIDRLLNDDEEFDRITDKKFLIMRNTLRQLVRHIEAFLESYYNKSIS